MPVTWRLGVKFPFNSKEKNDCYSLVIKKSLSELVLFIPFLWQDLIIFNPEEDIGLGKKNHLSKE